MAEERQQAREKVHRLGQELFELGEQIKATEGHRIQLKIRALRSSYYVFEGNYRRLVTALDFFGRMEVFMELWREDNRTKLESFIDEVTRRLHNCLAGAQSLVEHTRVFKNKVDLTRSGGHLKVWRQSLREGSPHAEEYGGPLHRGVQS